MQFSKEDPQPIDDRASATDSAAQPAVLLQGIEAAMTDLFAAWLALDGLRTQRSALPGEPIALILVDLPFPRQNGEARVRQLSQAWPGVPVLALSSTFLPGVAAQGDVARQLGATAVLAAPVARDTLRAAVATLLHRSCVA